MRRSILALAMAGTLSSSAAMAGVYWQGDANARSVVLIDFSTIQPQPNGETSFILRALSPRGTKMNGRPIALTSFYTVVNCETGAMRMLGGTVFGEDAQVVMHLRPDRDPKTPQRGSPGWRHLRLVCASNDEERSHFGIFAGEAALGDIVERLRPGPVMTN